MVETSTHSRQFVVRGPNKPPDPFDGKVWVDTSGNNVETNQYNAAAGVWELIVARGPDTPEYPVDGALWADTGSGDTKTYNASTSSWNTVTQPNVPEWQEDANSPYDDTKTSHTYTVASDYTKVWVVVDGSVSGDQFFFVQVNGDTGSNYNFTTRSATETTGAGSWSFNNTAADWINGFTFMSAGGDIFMEAHNPAGGDVTVAGDNTNVTPPLDSFTIESSAGNSFRLRMRVYGLTV